MTIRPQVVKLPAPLCTYCSFCLGPQTVLTTSPLLSFAQMPFPQASLAGLPENHCLPPLSAGFFCPSVYLSALEAEPQEGGALPGCWPWGLVQWVPSVKQGRPAALRGERAGGPGQSCFLHAALLPTAHLFPGTGDTGVCSLNANLEYSRRIFKVKV